MGMRAEHGEAEAEEHASRRVLERMPSRDGIHCQSHHLAIFDKVSSSEVIKTHQIEKMIEELDYSKYITLDKSWIIRIGVLDMINGYDDINKFLDTQVDLGNDLLALKKILKVWNTYEPVDVGESGTLYRILQFASWKLNLNKNFILRGTLKNRKINNNPSIVS